MAQKSFWKYVCGECECFYTREREGIKSTTCHAGPPAALLAPRQTPLGEVTLTTVSIYPPVDPVDTACGQLRLRKGKDVEFPTAPCGNIGKS